MTVVKLRPTPAPTVEASTLSEGRLPRSRALGLSISGAFLALSGTAMVVFRYLLPSDDPFSAYPHALWPWLLGFHVFPIPIFAFYVGSIWWHHVARHWHARTRRFSGVVLIACMGLLALTGFLLYFVGSEQWIRLSRVSHAVLGTAGFLLYVLHAALGWRALRREQRSGAGGAASRPNPTAGS